MFRIEWLVAIVLTGAAVSLGWFWHHTRGRPDRWLRVLLGWGRSVEDLARWLQLEPDHLRSHEPVYRIVFVPKKNGGRRRLTIPDPETKRLQRRLLRRLLRHLPAHPAATAYERGKSVVDNARPHVGRAVVLRLDLVQFFPSLSADRVERYFRNTGWNREAAQVLTRLTTYEGGLPQGAPTSPRLSNLLMWPFDLCMERHAKRRRAVYTRYADDLTISYRRDTPRRVRGTVQYVRQLARAFGLELHAGRKLRILRSHQQQRVTGLVVNHRLQLPRSVRRRLRAITHRLRTGKPTSLSAHQLQGWRGYVEMIRKGQEPG